MRTLRNLFAGLLALLLSVGPALGHPHVFLDGTLTFRAAQGRLTALEVTWEFDEAFSQGMAGDFDRDGNGVFDPRETRELCRGGFENLKDFGYFLRLEMDGKVLPPLRRARDFSPRMDPASGRMIYRFVLPVDLKPRKGGSTLVVSFYDTSYYVDTLWAGKRPGVAAGDGSLPMTFSPGKGKVPSEYWGTCEVPQLRVRLGGRR